MLPTRVLAICHRETLHQVGGDLLPSMGHAARAGGKRQLRCRVRVGHAMCDTENRWEGGGGCQRREGEHAIRPKVIEPYRTFADRLFLYLLMSIGYPRLISCATSHLDHLQIPSSKTFSTPGMC